MKKKKATTAAEIVARLNADPEWRARRAKQDAERQRRELECQRAEAPLLEELRTAGFSVGSVWDLVNTPGTYPGAVPILLAHLERPYPEVVREGIARALAVPQAQMGWSTLTQMYRKEQTGRVKDGLAAAIAVAADDVDEFIDELIELASDTSNGPSRLLLLAPLERSTNPRAGAALMSLGTDPELYKEVQVILRRLNRGK